MAVAEAACDNVDPRQLEGKRRNGERALRILDQQLADRPFIAGDAYTIADISLFAYAHRAEEAGLATAGLLHFGSWVARVRDQQAFLATMYPYDLDPHSSAELP